MLMIMSLIHEQYDSPQSMTPILLHCQRIGVFLHAIVVLTHRNLNQKLRKLPFPGFHVDITTMCFDNVIT